MWLFWPLPVQHLSGQDVQKWKWHHDTSRHFCWPPHRQEKYTENLMYSTPHLTLLKPKKNPTTHESIWFSSYSGSGSDVEISLWHAVPLQVGQSLASSSRAEQPRTFWELQGFSQVRSGHGWSLSSSMEGLALLRAVLVLVGALALWVRSCHRDSSVLPQLWRAPRLPHICVLSDPAAGSCSLSLYPLMDGSVSLWPHPPSSTTSLHHSILIPLRPDTDPLFLSHSEACRENKGNASVQSTHYSVSIYDVALNTYCTPITKYMKLCV